MASTSVNNTAIDVSLLSTTALNTKAAATGKKVSETTQDFSSVFNSTTQNSKSDNQTKNKSVTNDTKTTATSTSDNAQDVSLSDTKDTAYDDANKGVSDVAVEKEVSNDNETKPDDTIIEEIATALSYILDQLKEIIGADDDQIVSSLQDLGIDMGDLLNSDNLANIVASLSGEDSAISLVANEDLYSKLQSLTDVVTTQFETVLENTGLSKDELLQALENFVSQDTAVGETVQEQSAATVVAQLQTQTASVTEKAKEETVFSVVDNTTKPATTTETLPENQQDTSDLKNDSQSANSKTEKNDDNQSKDYSQNQSLGQNQDSTVNENVQETGQPTTSYTSESTESIMRQLADQIKLIKDDSMTQMELQLHPASLGNVNINLITKGGAITAQFTTQSEQVRAAIESQIATLQQDLENQGIKVEAIEVAVESHQMEKNLDEDNQRREKEGEQAEESMRATRRANINLRDIGEDGSVLEEIQGADEATRIAMELMSANGNTMDVMA